MWEGRAEFSPARLRGHRERVGRTQAELAWLVSVSETMIRNYEHGRNSPSVMRLIRLAGALGLPVEEFLRRFEDPHDDYRDARVVSLSHEETSPAGHVRGALVHLHEGCAQAGRSPRGDVPVLPHPVRPHRPAPDGAAT